MGAGPCCSNAGRAARPLAFLPGGKSIKTREVVDHPVIFSPYGIRDANHPIRHPPIVPRRMCSVQLEPPRNASPAYPSGGVLIPARKESTQTNDVVVVAIEEHPRPTAALPVELIRKLKRHI